MLVVAARGSVYVILFKVFIFVRDYFEVNLFLFQKGLISVLNLRCNPW